MERRGGASMDGTPANEEGCLIRDKALCMDTEAQMKKPMRQHGFLNISPTNSIAFNCY